MREVYIEFAVIDNLIMDYILLREAAVCCARKFKPLRLFLSSLVGTAGAVLLPLLSVAPLYSFLIKLFIGALMAFVCVKHRTPREYLVYFNVFLLFTFITGGAIIALFSFAGIKYDLAAYTQAGVVPMGLALLAAFALALGVKTFIRRAVKKIKSYGDVMPLIIKAEGKLFELSGFLDSGNTLKDERTGLPVIMISKRSFEKMKLRIKPVKAGRIYFTTAAGFVSTDIYRADYVKFGILGKEKSACFAVEKAAYAGVNADAIVGKALL